MAADMGLILDHALKIKKNTIDENLKNTVPPQISKKNLKNGAKCIIGNEIETLKFCMGKEVIPVEADKELLKIEIQRVYAPDYDAMIKYIIKEDFE